MINTDIQYCRGAGCLLHDTCRRAKDEKIDGEVWFADEPFRIIDEKFNCDLYWQKTQMSIFDETNESKHDEAGADKQTDGGESGT